MIIEILRRKEKKSLLNCLSDQRFKTYLIISKKKIRQERLIPNVYILTTFASWKNSINIVDKK